MRDDYGTLQSWGKAASAFAMLTLFCALEVPNGAWAVDSAALSPGQTGFAVMGDSGYDAPEDSKEPVSIANVEVDGIDSVTYDGKAKTPEVDVETDGEALEECEDYTLSYSKYTNDGKASVTISGIGEFTGSKTVNFAIEKAPISKAKVSKIKNRTATAKAKKPKPIVKVKGKKLKSGRDYKLSYKNNKAVGTAKAIVKGKGSCKGKKVVKFKIIKPKASTITVRVAAPAATAHAAAPVASTGDDEVYITNTGEKFHRGTCRWLYA